MAHPFQQRKLLVTVCKAEVGWDQQECPLQSGCVTLVAGPFKASTRSVPAARGGRAGGCGLLNWAPSLGGELFVLSEDCVLVADMVLGAELWGQRKGAGRWASESLYAQAEICLDAEGQALLLSGRCLEVRLPLMAPQGQAGGKGKGGAGGGGGTSGRAAGTSAARTPVLGVLALSMLLQPSDAEAAVTRQLPVELVPRLLLDTSRLLPGAVVRGAAGAAYVDPCVVFLRVRLVSVSGLGRGSKDAASARSSSPWARRGSTAGRAPGHGGGAPGAALPGAPGLPIQLQELGTRLHAHVDRTLGHVGAFFSKLKEGRAEAVGGHGRGRGQQPHGQQQAVEAAGVAEGRAARTPLSRMSQGTAGETAGLEPTAAVWKDGGGEERGAEAGKGPGVDTAAAEAVMSLLESNGFAVVDHRRLSNYFWCKVSYEGQYHTSRLMPVAGGSVHWDETFVVAALRPIRPAPLEIELYGSNDSKSRGKVVCSLAVPLCDVVDQMLAQHTARRRAQRQQEQREEAQWRQQRQAERAAASARRQLWGLPGSAFGGGGSPSRRRQLPPYHPDTWPRGRVTLPARLGAAGGHIGATAGAPGGPGASRDCAFTLELEVVDADRRATAMGTQLLPWARPRSAEGTPSEAEDAAEAAGSGGSGSAGGDLSGAATAAAEATEGGGSEQTLSPPWSPGSGRAGDGGGSTLSPASSVSVLSLGALIATSVEESQSLARPAASAPGAGDPWLPPRASQSNWSFAGSERPAEDSSAGPDTTQPPSRMSMATVPEPTAAANAATAGAAPQRGSHAPTPGLCSAAALAASAAATLSLVIHDLELELPPPPEGVIGGAGSGAAAAAYAASLSAITQGDYFVAVRCGSMWATTNSLRVVGAGAGAAASAGSAAAASLAVGFPGGRGGGSGPRLAPHVGLVAPLLRPSALVSLALFRRTDTVAGKKVLNVRAMIGMMAAEQLVGKLRLRGSSLVPGQPVTVCLPLKAERSGPRPGTVAWCRMTLLLSPGPTGLSGLLSAYAEPPTYPPVAMLLEGAVSGRGLSDTLPVKDPTKRADADALKRRQRRVVMKWVSESSPGIPANAAKKLLEDGRTEFNAGRTTQNWRRISKALSGTEPLKGFWARVQSWEQPGLTLAVAAGELALLAWPSRVMALLLLALLLHLLRVRVTMLRPAAESGADAAADGVGFAGAEADGLREQAAETAGWPARGPEVAAASEAPGSERPPPCPRSWLGEPSVMVDDIGSEPEPTAASAASAQPTDGEAGAEQAGGGPPAAPPGLMAGSAAAGPSAPLPALSSASSTASVATAAGWLFGTSPPSASSSMAAAASAGAGDWSCPPQSQRGASLSGYAGGPGGPGGGIGGGGGGHSGSEVPKDPLHMLRQQYDGMVYMGLRVQNILDDIAGGMERAQALLSWRDPVATAAFAVCLLLAAALLWGVGVRALLGALLLYDLRPPRWRDPWLPPPANAFTHLPTRADLMM